MSIWPLRDPARPAIAKLDREARSIIVLIVTKVAINGPFCEMISQGCLRELEPLLVNSSPRA